MTLIHCASHEAYDRKKGKKLFQLKMPKGHCTLPPNLIRPCFLAVTFAQIIKRQDTVHSNPALFPGILQEKTKQVLAEPGLRKYTQMRMCAHRHTSEVGMSEHRF